VAGSLVGVLLVLASTPFLAARTQTNSARPDYNESAGLTKSYILDKEKPKLSSILLLLVERQSE
jgi:hypothetical protein